MSALDDLLAYARRFSDLPPPRQFHCGRAVWDVLRNASPNATDVLGLTAAHLPATGLYGVPVHIDLEMADGAWKLTEQDGTVVASGNIAPGYRAAFYVPGVGVVAFPPEEATR